MAPAGVGGCVDAGDSDCRHDRPGAVRSPAPHSRRSALMDAAVEVRDLKAWFGKTEALHGITISVPPNHATAVIGPSGCGKSTFIRCLNRMHETNPEARAEGEVRIGGMDIYGVPAVDVRRRVGRPPRAR